MLGDGPLERIMYRPEHYCTWRIEVSRRQLNHTEAVDLTMQNGLLHLLSLLICKSCADGLRETYPAALDSNPKGWYPI